MAVWQLCEIGSSKSGFPSERFESRLCKLRGLSENPLMCGTAPLHQFCQQYGSRRSLGTLQQCYICFCSFRDLDARAKSERYRALFRLPKDEKLDGHTDCTLWTPFNKMHILGQMFVSTNYICFTSKEETACSLIIPLREVRHWIAKLMT